MHISQLREDEKKGKTMFTAIAYGNSDEILSPSDSFIRFNREVVSRRSELPQMWKDFIVSLRRYCAYISKTGNTSPRVIEDLYDFLFYYSNGQRKLYQDYRASRLKDNEDPEYLYKKYREYFPDEDEGFSDLIEEVLKCHYVAALAAHSVARRRECLERKQIHPLVVKTLRYSYDKFWAHPEDGSECFSDSHYGVSRKQECTIPWQEEFPELEDFSDDRIYGSDPPSGGLEVGSTPWMCDMVIIFFVAACHTSLEI